jgi:carboxypeptidase family protein
MGAALARREPPVPDAEFGTPERMRLPVRTLAAVSTLLVLCATPAGAQVRKGIVRVEVVDSSGGRLPGVAVVATSVDGQVLTAVTDRAGVHVFPGISVGPVMLRFRLEGFSGVMTGVTVEPGVEVRVVQRLEVAPFAETVVVEAPAPPAPPRRPPPPPPPVPQRGPVIGPVPPHDRDAVCGPAKPGAAPESLGTIRSSRFVADGGLYTTGAQIDIDGGTSNGLEVGQNLVVRHYFRVRPMAGAATTAEHSAGLVQIAAASERSSIAVVIYACGELRAGDFLAAFKPEPLRPPDPPGTPDFRDAARILFADEGQILGAPRRLMVIDRGSDQGIRAGQRLTLFRRHAARPEVIGDAIVVATRIDSATIRVERVTDTIFAGDLAAPQIPNPATNR